MKNWEVKYFVPCLWLKKVAMEYRSLFTVKSILCKYLLISSLKSPQFLDSYCLRIPSFLIRVRWYSWPELNWCDRTFVVPLRRQYKQRDSLRSCIYFTICWIMIQIMVTLGYQKRWNTNYCLIFFSLIELSCLNY